MKWSNENACFPNDILCLQTPGALGVPTKFPVLSFAKKSNTYFVVPALLGVSETQCWKEEPCVYDHIVSVASKRFRSMSIIRITIFPVCKQKHAC